MAVKYLAGNRIQGTNAERTAESLPSGTYAGWKEIGRTTLGSAGDTIDVTGLANKKYLMILRYVKSSGNTIVINKLNGTSGNEYSLRWSENDGTEQTAVNQSTVMYDTGGDAGDKFDVTYISNLSGNEKLAIGHQTNTDGSGAGVTPVKGETVWKWANTSEPIDQITTLNTGQSGDYMAGSEVVVLGYDPTATETANFWEELASVDLSGGASDTLSSGTISKKKYLWVQGYIEQSNNVAYNIRFNGQAGSNYALRYAVNGNQTKGNISDTDSIYAILTDGGSSSISDPVFFNMFIVNAEGREKPVILQSIAHDHGDSYAWRMNVAGKWQETGEQIDTIDIVNDVSGGDYTTTSFMKVWGHD